MVCRRRRRCRRCLEVTVSLSLFLSIYLSLSLSYAWPPPSPTRTHRPSPAAAAARHGWPARPAAAPWDGLRRSLGDSHAQGDRTARQASPVPLDQGEFGGVFVCCLDVGDHTHTNTTQHTHTYTHTLTRAQVPNQQLKDSFWWDLIPAGDLAVDAARLEDEFAAEETKELKTKKKEEVCVFVCSWCVCVCVCVCVCARYLLPVAQN
jgi:hypothetical protein